MHEHGRLRRLARGRENFLLILEGIAEDHRRGREVAEHELVALLGDRRRGGDVDDVGNAFLLGDLGDRGALAGVEGADQKLSAVADHLLGARAGDIDLGFGVAVHDLKLGQAELLEQPGGDIDAALAILADAGLIARARQQHADFKRRRRRRGTMLNGAMPAVNLRRRARRRRCGG